MKKDLSPIHPTHYKNHPSKIECIDICEHLSANLMSAFKYVWRHMKKDNPIQDLEKAIWFLNREIKLRKGKRINKQWKNPLPPSKALDMRIKKVLKYETGHKFYVLLSIFKGNYISEDFEITKAVGHIKHLIDAVKING